MEDGVTEVLSSVMEDIGRDVSRNHSGAQLLHDLLSAPWLRALLKIYECLLHFQRLTCSPFLSHASGLSHEVMTIMQKTHSPSAEARELYSLLSSPHIQALLSSHDSVAQSNYGPVFLQPADELPEDDTAVSVVGVGKSNQHLSGGESKGSVRMISSRWSSLRRLTLERLIPARRAWSGEELRVTDSEARILPLSQCQTRPFLPHFESKEKCRLCQQTTELWKKGLNKSAPSVFTSIPCTEKPKPSGGEGASGRGNNDDYAYPPPPVPAYTISLPSSPVRYRKGAAGVQWRNLPTSCSTPCHPGMNPLRAHTAPSTPAAQRYTRQQGVNIADRPHRCHTASPNKGQENLSMLHCSTTPCYSRFHGRPKHHQPPPSMTKQCSVEELRSTVQTVAGSIEQGTQDVRNLGQTMVAVTEMITDSVEENAQALNLLAEVVEKLQGLIVSSKHTDASSPPKNLTPPTPPPRVSSTPPPIRKPPTPYPRHLSSSSSSSCSSSSSSSSVSSCTDAFTKSRRPRPLEGSVPRASVSFSGVHRPAGGGSNGQMRLNNGMISRAQEQHDYHSTGCLTIKKKTNK